MKEEALKLADLLNISGKESIEREASAMIRRLVEELDKQEYRKTHEGFSTIIDKVTPQKRCEPICKPSVCDCIRAKPLSDEEILDLCPPNHSEMMNEAYTIDFARAIEERHGIK